MQAYSRVKTRQSTQVLRLYPSQFLKAIPQGQQSAHYLTCMSVFSTCMSLFSTGLVYILSLFYLDTQLILSV